MNILEWLDELSDPFQLLSRQLSVLQIKQLQSVLMRGKSLQKLIDRLVCAQEDPLYLELFEVGHLDEALSEEMSQYIGARSNLDHSDLA